jgi:Zn-dependent peptidase ImmA (M78 family)
MSRFDEIEELAEAVANTHFPDDRIEPVRIAEKNGITYNFGHYGKAFDGLLEYLNGRFHIYGNSDRIREATYPRARFTVGHELGHYYIDTHRRALSGGVKPHPSFTEFQSENAAEREADTFAANLLMPKRRFVASASGMNPGADTIRSLASLFGTSYSSTAIRYALADVASVIVMRWTSEERKWCWSSRDLWELTRNKAYRAVRHVPADSRTGEMLRRTFATEGESLSKGSTVSTWFPFIRAESRDNLILVEETIGLGEFGVLTILYPDR